MRLRGKKNQYLLEQCGFLFVEKFRDSIRKQSIQTRDKSHYNYGEISTEIKFVLEGQSLCLKIFVCGGGGGLGGLNVGGCCEFRDMEINFKE